MNYYNEIRDELINNEVYKKVKDYSKNKSDLRTYYNVGKLLSEAGKHYGEGIIKDYSRKLKIELGKSYSTRLLYKMIRYYNFILKQKVPTLSANLSWSHYDELLKFDDINKINYYISITEKQNLSVRNLRERIKNNEYERLPKSTRNKLITKEKLKLSDMVKNPIIIKNKYNTSNISEKMLQTLILEDIPSFLNELGEGFSFIKNEYKIKIGNDYNYIDLLLYNIIYKCYVVVELKVTNLKKEHIGQIQIYMNYIDKNIKCYDDNKTIGIIICKKENKFIIEYSSDDRIFERKYILS